MAQNRQADEAHVRALDDQERAATLARDIPTMERLWSDELTVNAPNNQVVIGRRAVFDTFVHSGIINFSTFERHIEFIRADGALVIIMGLETVTPRGDAPGAGLIAGRTIKRRFTNIWKNEEGTWRLFVRHANVIPILSDMHFIRSERPEDIPAIRHVNEAAFPTAAEADLVDALRQQAQPIVSLVAIDGDALVGHILFSPVTLSSHPEIRIMGLAPIAIVPLRQRQESAPGSCARAWKECRRQGSVAVVVLGHAGYYPRFGFAAASRFGIASEYDVPDDVFMALELRRQSAREIRNDSISSRVRQRGKLEGL